MAHMFPSKEYISELPYSEMLVYELLSELGNSYTVFHSVQWMKRANKWKSTWKENDFLNNIDEEIINKDASLDETVERIYNDIFEK